MRFRPPFVAASVMLVVSATVAAAIAGSRSNAGRAPVAATGGFTPVPASDPASGTYCPLPIGDEHTPAVTADSSSSGDLVFDGQSAIPDSAPPAICAGSSPAAVLISP